MPLGFRINKTIYASGLAGVDPVTGEPAGDLKRQIGTALQHMRRMVERAGGSIDNVGRAVGFCTRVEDRDIVDQVWMDLFPDPNDKPAFKVLLAELPAGQLVRIDALAILGETRKRFDIPNVAAHDPTVKIGNMVFSSRCHGNNQSTGQIVEGGLEAEAHQTLDNLCTLIKLSGGAPDNIVQITTFGHDASYLEPTRRVFEEHFPDKAKRPELNQVVNFVSARMQVAMEMVAVL
jgi:2-iminobutanoate/2-iminopropanoate deaminase